MAYARYSRDSDWYIFWQADAAAAGRLPSKEAEVLAIWHADHRALAPSFPYAQVGVMLAKDDFSIVPGFCECDRALLRACLAEFIKDVDDAYRESR